MWEIFVKGKCEKGNSLKGKLEEICEREKRGEIKEKLRRNQSEIIADDGELMPNSKKKSEIPGDV